MLDFNSNLIANAMKNSSGLWDLKILYAKWLLKIFIFFDIMEIYDPDKIKLDYRSSTLHGPNGSPWKYSVIHHILVKQFVTCKQPICIYLHSDGSLTGMITWRPGWQLIVQSECQNRSLATDLSIDKRIWKKTWFMFGKKKKK